MRSRYSTRFAPTVAIIVALTFPLKSLAAPDSELIGKILEQDKSVGLGALIEGMANGEEAVSDQNAVAGIFDGLVGGNKIRSVSVEEAEPGRLVLSVEFKNFQNYELVARVVGKSGGVLDSHIPPVKIDPGTKQGNALIDLTMPSTGQVSLESSHVRFEAKPKNGSKASAYTYKLRKTWGTGTNVVAGSGVEESETTRVSGDSLEEVPPVTEYLGKVVPVTLVGVNEETRNLPKTRRRATVVRVPTTKAVDNRTNRSAKTTDRRTSVTVSGTRNTTDRRRVGDEAAGDGTARRRDFRDKGEETRDRDGNVTDRRRTGEETAGDGTARRRDYRDKGDDNRRDDNVRDHRDRPDQRERPRERERNKKARGPSDEILPLLGDAVVSVPTMQPDDILPFFYNVYRDANPHSGVFYFVPSTYRLKWDEDDGHDIDINLGAQGGAAATNTVSISASLKSGIGFEDAKLARTLAKAYAVRHGNEVKVSEMRPLITNTVPVTTLKDDLKQNSIDVENISINPGNDILRELNVSWTSDAVTKANIYQLLRNDRGIRSQLTFRIDDEEEGAVVSVPTHMALASSNTFGKIAFKRNEAWENKTPYPVTLKYIHALVLVKRVPVVYSWELGDTVLQPKDSVQWNAQSVPTWVDDKALRMWGEYTVDSSCEPCNQRVLESIEKGVILKSHPITVDPMNSLDAVGAYEISVMIRSRYLSPSPTPSPDFLPWVRLRESGQEVEAGTLHLGQRKIGEARPSDPLLSYRVAVVMDGTGERHEGQNWIPLNDTRIILGTSQIEASLGYLPE